MNKKKYHFPKTTVDGVNYLSSILKNIGWARDAGLTDRQILEVIAQELKIEIVG